jgi:hypothetical protein
MSIDELFGEAEAYTSLAEVAASPETTAPQITPTVTVTVTIIFIGC